MLPLLCLRLGRAPGTPPPHLVQRGEEGDRLDGLAEAHLVGQDDVLVLGGGVGWGGVGLGWGGVWGRRRGFQAAAGEAAEALQLVGVQLAAP
jgi:hypothetical protein